jgi:hypothetical protein
MMLDLESEQALEKILVLSMKKPSRMMKAGIYDE